MYHGSPPAKGAAHHLRAERSGVHAVMKLPLVLLGFVLPTVAQAADPAPSPVPSGDLAERLARVERELAALKAERNAPAPSPAPAHAGGTAGPIANISEGSTRTGTKATLTIGGYVEAFYQWNFNEPGNRITNYRGFDNRHDSFTIANAAVDAAGSLGPVSAHVVLQIGHTPETYYLAEPLSQGTNAAATTDSQVWKFLQQAIVAWTAPLGRGLTIDAGIFLSPIGPEGMAIKDQWNFSRSDAFFGLPFYHTGFRFTYPFTDHITASLQVYNGWNSVVDNNVEKSLAGQFTYNIPDKVTFNFIYFTGVERPTGAPEGRAWRHLFDAYVAVYPRPWLSALLQVDGGFEPNNFGTSGWTTAVGYLRARAASWLYLAARGDFFYEWIPSNSMGTATPIFWNGANWISSFTGTIDLRPFDNISFRVEYRHDEDQAQHPLFFQNTVQMNLLGAFVPNASSQNTLTFGAVAWF
jgi:hypothetical protein